MTFCACEAVFEKLDEGFNFMQSRDSIWSISIKIKQYNNVYDIIQIRNLSSCLLSKGLNIRIYKINIFVK